jgi:hypothetical protein
MPKDNKFKQSAAAAPIVMLNCWIWADVFRCLDRRTLANAVQPCCKAFSLIIGDNDWFKSRPRLLFNSFAISLEHSIYCGMRKKVNFSNVIYINFICL